MSFGKNLQYLRQLSRDMTQEALAEKLSVSRQTISKWEVDAANPEMDKALEIELAAIRPKVLATARRFFRASRLDGDPEDVVQDVFVLLSNL